MEEIPRFTPEEDFAEAKTEEIVLPEVDLRDDDTLDTPAHAEAVFNADVSPAETTFFKQGEAMNVETAEKARTLKQRLFDMMGIGAGEIQTSAEPTQTATETDAAQASIAANDKFDETKWFKNDDETSH